MPTESVLEEPATEDARTNNRRRIRDKKRDHEGWCHSQGAIVGHCRPREIQSHHSCALSKGARLPSCLRCNQPQNLYRRQILARFTDGLSWARDSNNACWQQSWSSRRWSSCQTGNLARGVATLHIIQGHEIRGDKHSDQPLGAVCLSGPAPGDLLETPEHACQFSTRGPQDPQLAILDTLRSVVMVRRLQLVKSRKHIKTSFFRYIKSNLLTLSKSISVCLH